MNARKILGYALGPIGSAAFGLFSLPLISWYFPAEDIGRIVLLQTISSLAILVLGLGLDHAYIREYYATEDKASLFKSITLSPFALVLIGAVIIAAWNAAMPSEWIFSLDDKLLGILFLIFLTNTLFARFFALILRMQEKAVTFSLSQLTPKFLILVMILSYVVFGLPTNTTTLVLAYTLAQVLSVLVLMYLIRHDLKDSLRAKWSSKLHKTSLHYGLPLAAGNIAYWGLTSIDRFVLKELGNLEELGIYSMAVSFGAIALIFQSVFSTIWAPLVFKWVKENTNLDKIGDITLSMTSLISALICIVGICSPIVTWILPNKYAPVQFILLSSMLFPLLYTLTEVSGIGLNVVKKTWLITAISVIAFIFNFIFLRWLVPVFGARGAAMANASAFWIFFVLKTEFSSRLWQALPHFKIYSSITINLTLCLSYTYLGNEHNYVFFALIWLIGLTILILQYQKPLKTTFLTIQGRLKNKNHA